MFKFETLIAIAANLLREVLVDRITERLIKAFGRFRRGPKGMVEIRRHVHTRCRQRLLRRLSTLASEK